MRPSSLLFLLCAALGCASAATREAPPPSDLARIAGVVVDSVTRAGVLPGATVSIPSLSRFTRSDDAGRFRFDSLPPGRHQLVATHPALDSARLYEIGATVDAPGGRFTEVVLATPPPAVAFASICGAEPRADGASGIVLGTLRDARDGRPLQGGEVRLRWSEWVLGEHVDEAVRGAAVPVDSSGHFVICGDFADAMLEVQAVHGDRRSGVVVLTPTGGVLRPADIQVGESASLFAAMPADSGAVAPADTLITMIRAEGTGSVVGRVTSGETPLAGAVVELMGVALQERTDADGRFHLAGVPTGTHTLLVRALGYAPRAVPLVIGGAVDSADVDLARAEHTLDAVQVFGRRAVRSAYRDELLRRTRTGQTKLLDLEMIERVGISSALRMQPFVYRLGSGVDTYIAFKVGGRYCIPPVFVDGIALPSNMVNVPGGFPLDYFVAPSEIAAVEYVRGTVPASFEGYMVNAAEMQGGVTCGAIAIWRK